MRGAGSEGTTRKIKVSAGDCASVEGECRACSVQAYEIILCLGNVAAVAGDG